MRCLNRDAQGQVWRAVCILMCAALSFTSFPLLSTVSGQSRQIRDSANIPLPPQCTLRVENLGGNIQVVLTNRQGMEMLSGRHGAAGPAVQPDEIVLQEDTASGQVMIRTRPPAGGLGIDLRLSVPEGTNLRLTSDSGNIEVSGSAASILASTVQGNVQLVVPEKSNADVTLYSARGVVRSNLTVQTFGNGDDHSLQGTMGKGGGMVMGRSERGNVILTAPGKEQQIQIATKDPVLTRPQADDDFLGGGRGRPESLKPSTRTSNPASTGPDADLDDDNILRIESDLVTLNAAVSKRTGEAVTDLRKEDFTLFEDGIQQELIHFQPVTMPFNLVLLIDLSGSVKEKINLIKRSAMRFIQATRPEDKVAIVTFTATPRLVSPLTNDRQKLRQRIDSIREPDGGTNFYDALDYTINSVLVGVKGERNAIVIMSDGVDNALPGQPGDGSDITYEELMSRIQETDTIMFPIYLDTEEAAIEEFGMKISRGYAVAQRQLKEIAEATGGKVIYARRVEDLEGSYDQVANELRTIYSLGYYPTNTTRDGSFRKIRVRINVADAQVRSRRGYYAKTD